MKRSKKLMRAEIMPALQQKVQKKFSRRILSCILAVALILGGIPVFSFTTVKAVGADDLTLSADTADGALNEEGADLVSDEGVLDLRGTGIVTIPDASSEANSEYGGNTSIHTVILPNTLIHLGAMAFHGCTSLHTVIFEEGSNLKSIGKRAFQGCSSLTEFSLPDPVISIGEQAFRGCSSLNFQIGENSELQTIGIYAFERVIFSNDLHLPESLISVGRNAFQGCNSLKTVQFANPDTTIENQAFAKYASSVPMDILICGEPYGTVENYARNNGICFNRRTASLEIRPTEDWEGVLYYKDNITEGVLEDAGIEVFAEFVSDIIPKQDTISLSECRIIAADTTKVGERPLIVEYGGQQATLPFHVYYDLSRAEISDISSQVYTGAEICPEFTVTLSADSSVKLRQNRDYTVSWENHVDQGTATVTVTGIGNAKGTCSRQFIIMPRNIEDEMEVQLESDIMAYTGEAIEPAVTVLLEDKELVEGTDYTIEYSDNTEPGTALVTVTCMGNYEGRSEYSFTIQAQEPTAPPQTEAPTPKPTEAPQTEAPTQKPTEPPQTETPTQRPTELPQTEAPTQKPTAPTQTEAPTSKPTKAPQTEAPTPKPTKAPQTEAPTQKPTEAPQTEAPTPKPTKVPQTEAPTQKPTEAPQTEAPTSKPTEEPQTEAPTQKPTETPQTEAPTQKPTEAPQTETPAPEPTAPSQTEAPAQKPTAPPQTETPTPEPTAPSQIANIVKPGKVSKLVAKNKNKRAVSLSWKKISNAEKYEIEYATDKKFKKKKVISSEKIRYTVKKLKRKKTYYFRVRAYKLSGTRKIYGEWSAVKSVKIKK